MVSPSESRILSVEEISSSYDSSIVVRRWGATLIDFVVLCGSGLVALYALPENLQAGAFLLWCCLALAYYPLLEHRYGATVGKLACRIRVVAATGGAPSLQQTVVRTLLRLVEVNPVLMGGIPAGITVLVSKKRQRLGDMAAGTFVLKTVDLTDSLRPSARRTTTDQLPQGPMAVDPAALRLLLPVGRSGWAIVAGYLGLFAVLLVPAPFALAAGLLAVADLRRNPKLYGMGRAVFGIVMGVLGTVGLVIAIIYWAR
jgi:uncharacterized RDD family membrane protein YckC